MIHLLPVTKLKLKGINLAATSWMESTAAAAFDFQYNAPFSAVVWIKTTSGGGTGMQLVGKIKVAIVASTDRGWYLELGSGKPGFFLTNNFGSGTNWLYKISTGAVVNNGVWHQIVATYDGSATHAGMKIYQDAVLQATSNTGGPLSATIINPALVSIGGRRNAGGTLDGVTKYMGAMNEVMLYNVELTAADITALYGGGSPANPRVVGPTGNLVGYWRPELTDLVPTISDSSGGGNPVTCLGTLASTQADLFSR